MQAQPIPKTPTKGAMLGAWQQSLSEARQIAKMVLGRAASTVDAELNSRIYRGVSGELRSAVVLMVGRFPSTWRLPMLLV